MFYCLHNILSPFDDKGKPWTVFQLEHDRLISWIIMWRKWGTRCGSWLGVLHGAWDGNCIVGRARRRLGARCPRAHARGMARARQGPHAHARSTCAWGDGRGGSCSLPPTATHARSHAEALAPGRVGNYRDYQQQAIYFCFLTSELYHGIRLIINLSKWFGMSFVCL